MSNSSLVQSSSSDADEFLLSAPSEQLLSISLYFVCALFQSLLMVHFMCKAQRGNTQISKIIKCAVFLVLIMAWISILFDFFMSITDLVLSLSHTQCFIVYVLRFVRSLLFELLLCSFWMIRLNHTFKHSTLEIARYKFVFAFLLILILTLVLCAAFFYILSHALEGQYLSAREFVLPALDQQVDVCFLYWTPSVLFFAVLPSQLLIVSANILFAAIFYHKLKELHVIVIKSADQSKHSHARVQRIFELQQKHTLLACIPVACTLLLYVAFDAVNTMRLSSSAMFFLVDFDMLIKCLCTLLFFKFYERRFAQFCCCCVKCIGVTNEEYFPDFNPMQQRRNIYQRIQQQDVKRQTQKMRAQAIKNGTFNAQDFADDDEAGSDADDDEFNEDASRSYHAPDEAHKLFALSGAVSRELERVPSNVEMETEPYEGIEVGVDVELTVDRQTHAVAVADDEEDEDDDEFYEYEEYEDDGDDVKDVVLEEEEEEQDFIDRSPKNNTHHHTNTTMSTVELSPDDRLDPIHFVEICYWIEQLVDVQLGTVSQKLQMLETELEKDHEFTVDVHDIVEQTDIDEFFDILKDGVVLCRLLNTIRSDLCKGFKKSVHAMQQRANIQIFIDGCTKLGIRRIDIFDTNDLYEQKGLATVLRCLFALSAKAKDMPTYDGPFVGYRFSEKNERRFTVNTINKGKAAIPFMFRPPAMMTALSNESNVTSLYGSNEQ